MFMPPDKVQKNTVFATLIECIQEIPDPRRLKRISYPLKDVILMTICACLGGANNWVEVAHFCKDHAQWIQNSLNFSGKIPSHDTFNRIFNLVYPSDLTVCLITWMEQCFTALGIEQDRIHMDGKVLEAYAAENPLTLVRGWSEKLQCVIGSVRVDRGSNEITALPKLLDQIGLNKKIVTIDAIGAQKEIVEKITDKGGDYVIALKSNQFSLYEEASIFMNDIINYAMIVPHTREKSVEKNHGRIEERECVATSAFEWLEQASLWKNLKTIFAIRTTISWLKKDKNSTGIRYFISNLPAKADQLLHIARSHWSIENKLHWPVDRYLDEDRSTIRDSYGAQNFSFLRTLVVAIVQREQRMRPGRSIATIRQSVNRNPNLIIMNLLS